MKVRRCRSYLRKYPEIEEADKVKICTKGKGKYTLGSETTPATYSTKPILSFKALHEGGSLCLGPFEGPPQQGAACFGALNPQP